MSSFADTQLLTWCCVVVYLQALALHAPPTVRCAHVHADTRANCGCCPAMYTVGADNQPCARASRGRYGRAGDPSALANQCTIVEMLALGRCC
jgi:hypothetical protein